MATGPGYEHKLRPVTTTNRFGHRPDELNQMKLQSNSRVSWLLWRCPAGALFVPAAVMFALMSIPFSHCEGGIPEPDLVWYGKVLTSSGGGPVRITSGTLTWQIEFVAGGTPWTRRRS